MNHDHIDIQSLAKTFDVISNLTGLCYSLYDDRRNIILPPSREDALLSIVKKHKKGQEHYNNFIDKYLGLTVKFSRPLIPQGPSYQHHMFIPLSYREINMVVLAEAFYQSIEDFKKFCASRGHGFGVNENTIRAEDIKIINLAKASSDIHDIRSLLENQISSEYEKKEVKRSMRWMKTTSSLITDIKTDACMNDIYQLAVDSCLIHFEVDTAAVFFKKNGSLVCDVSGGKNRAVVQGIKFSEQERIISKAYASKAPVPVLDSHQILHSGLPGEIVSMYLFPISSDFDFFGILCIFNSLLDRESVDSIDQLCKLIARQCSMWSVVESHEKKSDKLSQASLKISGLYNLHKNPRKLYADIVKEAAGLVDAGRCSLMMPDDSVNALRIKAVKGVNELIMKDFSITIGEGIAGTAYKNGVPIIIDKEEEFKNYRISPRPLFKTFSCLSLPLKMADEVIGVLNLTDKYTGSSFTNEDLLILTPFALQIFFLLKIISYHEALEHMKELSITDSLTGIFNRRYFDIRFAEEFQSARRYGHSLSIAIADIDDFKLLNDTEGHLFGDRILREVASIMVGSIRKNDILTRFGGEEFAVIMPKTVKAEAFHVAERIKNNITDMLLPEWRNYPKERLTVSIGIAEYPECGEPMNNLVHYADLALYNAKRKGKNLIAAWDNGSSHKKIAPNDSLHKMSDEV